jgi:hypothetical protein
MIQYFIIASAVISALTGATVIALGEWKRFALKFAAVALCFAIDCGFLGIVWCHPDELMNPKNTEILTTVGLLIMAKNLDHVLFYVAFGRDAIKLKRGERRCQLYEPMKEAA